MKFQKLVNELNGLLDSSAREQHKHHEKLKFYLRQFKTEEQDLRKKLKREDNKTNRKRLKRDLGMVKKGYQILGNTA
jgi:hypothetical protein